MTVNLQKLKTILDMRKAEPLRASSKIKPCSEKIKVTKSPIQ